jgi:hypothetical protein
VQSLAGVCLAECLEEAFDLSGLPGVVVDDHEVLALVDDGHSPVREAAGSQAGVDVAVG